MSEIALQPEYRQFLNQLRRSGVTNMYGASPYIAEAFDLSSSEARKVLGLWMEVFDSAVDA